MRTSSDLLPWALFNVAGHLDKKVRFRHCLEQGCPTGNLRVTSRHWGINLQTLGLGSRHYSPYSCCFYQISELPSLPLASATCPWGWESGTGWSRQLSSVRQLVGDQPGDPMKYKGTCHMVGGEPHGQSVEHGGAAMVQFGGRGEKGGKGPQQEGTMQSLAIQKLDFPSLWYCRALAWISHFARTPVSVKN